MIEDKTRSLGSSYDNLNIKPGAGNLKKSKDSLVEIKEIEADQENSETDSVTRQFGEHNDEYELEEEEVEN